MKVNTIRKEVSQYKSFKKFQEIMAGAGMDEIQTITKLNITYLRNLAKLKASYPYSFRFACMLEKIRLN